MTTSHQLTKGELRLSKATKRDFDALSRRPISIVLDSLKSAHNVGTILRLADAILAEKVYICGNTIVPPNYKLRLGSQGAERWVPWEYRETASEVVARLKSEGTQIVAVEVTSESVNYLDATYRFPVCIVVGREYDGVSPELLNLADLCVSLPIDGMCNSINVSTATAVMLYKLAEHLPSVAAP